MSKKVLIIDDDDALSSLLRDFLVSKGYTVCREADGPSGAARAREMLPDLITLDFNMPGENGVETYNELHRYPETAVIPVIFLSSTLSGADKERMLRKIPGSGS